MFVSTETIAIVLSAVGIVITQGVGMLAGFSWCIRRSDRVEEKFGGRIDGVEEKLGSRIDAVRTDLADVERSLGTRIDAIADDTTELKIAMARLEGPQRHLIVAAR
jgi:hypothetical protein